MEILKTAGESEMIMIKFLLDILKMTNYQVKVFEWNTIKKFGLENLKTLNWLKESNIYKTKPRSLDHMIPNDRSKENIDSIIEMAIGRLVTTPKVIS